MFECPVVTKSEEDAVVPSVNHTPVYRRNIFIYLELDKFVFSI